MRRRILMLATVALVLVVMMALGGGLASARPPSGSADTCPPRYDPMTLADILAQAQRLGHPEERARALFERVNKNEDGWICMEDLPGDPATSFNFIDNQAVGRDRS